MRLTKAQREQLRMKFDGKCAYCGQPLPERWHADHVLPVVRELKWESGKGPRPTGKVHRPENDTIENMMPSCPPCNIDKHNLSIEQWRAKLQNSTDVLSRNNPTYRHAIRFGLLQEVATTITFHFERVAAEIGRAM